VRIVLITTVAELQAATAFERFALNSAIPPSSSQTTLELRQQIPR
jgi:hypothetical protein